MELRKQVTEESWREDLQFVWIAHRQEPSVAESKISQYLKARYQAGLLPRLLFSLQAAYNWLARNYEFLSDLGLWTSESGVNRIHPGIVCALHNLVWSDPTVASWSKLPTTDPKIVVTMAQEFIDAFKK